MSPLRTARKPAPRAATIPLWGIQLFGMVGLAYVVLSGDAHPDLGAMGIFAGLILLSIGGRPLAEVLTNLKGGDSDGDSNQ